jgi:sRNA-binding carbon storage regulator CsrA
MLVLSRKIGEALVFGEEAKLTVDAVTADSATVTMTRTGGPDETKAIVVNLGEFAEISPNVRVILVEVPGDRPGIRLGLETPRDMPVYRKELLDRLSRGTD